MPSLEVGGGQKGWEGKGRGGGGSLDLELQVWRWGQVGRYAGESSYTSCLGKLLLLIEIK